MSKKRIQLLRDIRSIRSAGIRSIPKVLRSPYLELYTLSNEKKRLEKETYALEKRKTTADNLLENVDGRMEKIKKEISKEGKVKTYKNVRTNPVKTMPISY
jgi:predicted  nucleic acid-binding Zn-ribbon protein